jgi:hypothetical protein
MMTRRLGEILVERGLVSAADIARLLDSERAKGQPLGTLLVQQGLITEEDLLEALSEQFELPYWRKLEEAGIEHIPVSKVPIAFYRQQKVFPIACTDSGVKVAVNDPLNLQPLDDLANRRLEAGEGKIAARAALHRPRQDRHSGDQEHKAWRGNHVRLRPRPLRGLYQA